MQKNEQRVAAVKRRVVQIERQRKRRRARLYKAGAGAACFLLIVALAAVMPEVAAAAGEDYAHYAMAASIFGDGASLGYVVVGAVAFALGVAFALFCIRMRPDQGEDGNDRTD